MNGYKKNIGISIQKNRLLIIFFLVMESFVIILLHQYIERNALLNDKKVEKQKRIKKEIISDLEYFPIPIQYRNRIWYEDNYGAERIQGYHEGCDIMDTLDKPGQIPVVSCCDGVITNLGWLFLGGYRIGITGNSGTYFYYAHLDSYANGLEIGDFVAGGQFIGFMGNTGQGEEGTVGKFPTHLHFGIYQSHDEMTAVNPYPYLKSLE